MLELGDGGGAGGVEGVEEGTGEGSLVSIEAPLGLEGESARPKIPS